MKKSILFFFGFVLLTVLANGCAPAPTPTATNTPTPIPPTATIAPTSTPIPPSPTPTSTPTPIPGIGTPIIINDVGIQVLSAILEHKSLDPRYTLKSGYVTLSLEIAFSGGNNVGELHTKANAKKFLVVDENGIEYASYSESFLFSPSSSGTPAPPSFSMIYGFVVKEEPHMLLLRLPDGQTIDLTLILKSK